jgi:hypothetical protein
VSGNGSKLLALTRALSQQWRQTKEHWRDAKSQEFERRYLEELMAGVDRAATAMGQLEKLIAKIRKDCE